MVVSSCSAICSSLEPQHLPCHVMSWTPGHYRRAKLPSLAFDCFLPTPPPSAWLVLPVFPLSACMSLPAGSVPLIVESVSRIPVTGLNPSHGLPHFSSNRQSRCIVSTCGTNLFHFTALRLLFSTGMILMYSLSRNFYST